MVGNLGLDRLSEQERQPDITRIGFCMGFVKYVIGVVVEAAIVVADVNQAPDAPVPYTQTNGAFWVQAKVNACTEGNAEVAFFDREHCVHAVRGHTGDVAADANAYLRACHYIEIKCLGFSRVEREHERDIDVFQGDFPLNILFFVLLGSGAVNDLALYANIIREIKAENGTCAKTQGGIALYFSARRNLYVGG